MPEALESSIAPLSKRVQILPIPADCFAVNLAKTEPM
jgi:hypothetical protein